MDRRITPRWSRRRYFPWWFRWRRRRVWRRRSFGKLVTKMNAETFFTSEEQERIQQAVIAAEKNTSGEIVPMLVSASGRYAEVELSGVVIGLVLGTLVTFIWHD